MDAWGDAGLVKVFFDMDGVVADLFGSRAEGIVEDHSFWASLPLLQDGLELFRLVESRDIKPFFLTAPATSEACFSGKYAWVQKHFPAYIHRIIYCNQKQFLSKKDCLLIDDRDKNVDAFKKVVMGGRALLFPRPWNSKRAFSHDAYRLVSREVNRFL